MVRLQGTTMPPEQSGKVKELSLCRTAAGCQHSSLSDDCIIRFVMWKVRIGIEIDSAVTLTHAVGSTHVYGGPRIPRSMLDRSRCCSASFGCIRVESPFHTKRDWRGPLKFCTRHLLLLAISDAGQIRFITVSRFHCHWPKMVDIVER